MYATCMARKGLSARCLAAEFDFADGAGVRYMKDIIILGSTGSIGENALRVVKSLPDRFHVTGLAANSNWERILEQAAEFGVRTVALRDRRAAALAREHAPSGINVLDGREGVCELASSPDAGLVICAVVGMAALEPAAAAVCAGHDLAIATKEVLVAAGEFFCGLCRGHGVNLLPVDSEHSALFQALFDSGRVPACARMRAVPGVPDAPAEQIVARLILTASGGPFAFRPEVDFSKVTVEEALNHPRWKMGPKVTVDSATMMNKGLEIIEARRLFNMPSSRISVLVHPESIVHSLVEFADGAQIAQLGVPDMRLPIQYSMTWPERLGNETLPRLDLAAAGELHFFEPDPSRFPCLRLAREADAAGGFVPAAMNAANEAAVDVFLKGKIRLPDIWKTIEHVMERTPDAGEMTLESVLEVDAWARRTALEALR